MKAIHVTEPGGPEAMQLVDVPTPSPGPRQALVRIAASGVNFIDVYFRTGLYKADPPITIGSEAAGTVEAVGSEVTLVAPGDRVAYAMVRGSLHQVYTLGGRGAAGEASRDRRLRVGSGGHAAGHDRALPDPFDVPAGSRPDVPRARRRRRRRPPHRADGQSPRRACMRHRVVAEKAVIATAAGVDHAINYTETSFDTEVRRITGGDGVDIIYDSVGKTTFDKSMACLRPRGMLVLFGQSSGSVAPLDPQVLNTRGSIFLTRPNLGHHLLTREELLWRAGDVLTAVERGTLNLHIDRTYPLSGAADAHRDLESRRSTGKLLLIP